MQNVLQELTQGADQIQKTATGLPDLARLFPNSVDYITKFAFNHAMLTEFSEVQFAPFRVPVIYGFVAIHSVNFRQNLALISRKDCRRPGRRFVVRGLDKEGAAANFCETEHIITYKDKNVWTIASHLQIRGSIPLLWSMKPTLKWAPPVVVNPDVNASLQVAKKHISETNAEYKKQYFVNLIDKKGSQQRIGDKFTQLVTEMNDPDVEYVWFDFHGECKKMKWENLSKLVAQVKDKMVAYGHFMAELDVGFGQRNLIDSKTCRILCTQAGVMRTNCMDCLDRTNVVQGVFSRNIAHLQQHKLGLSSKPKEGNPFEKFTTNEMENAFRNAWTDNADALSILYTGTPALKTDFTRTGKRTQKGAIDDGKHSMIRYYINNFTDGYNQDCLDFC